MDELLFVDEVAQRLRVTRKTVYDWMRDGRLQYVVVGSRRRITQEALEAFIHAGNKENPEKKVMPGLIAA